MGFTAAQLRLIEEELKANDRMIEQSATLTTHDARQFEMNRWLPSDWREQLRDLTLSRVQTEAIDRIHAALRSYHGAASPVAIGELVAAWSSTCDGEFIERHVVTPLTQLAQLYRRIEALHRRSVEVDESSVERGATAEQLALKAARLVECDVATAVAFTNFVSARTKGTIEYAAARAIEAASAQYNAMREMFPDLGDELSPDDIEYVPHVTRAGEVIMVIESRVRHSQRLASRSDDNNNARQRRNRTRCDDPIEDDDAQGEEDSDENALEAVDVGQRLIERRDEVQRTGRALDLTLFSGLWHTFRFFSWLTIHDLIPDAISLLAGIYHSGYTRTILEQLHRLDRTLVYGTLNDVPIEVALFGTYGTGYYGVNSTSPLDANGVAMLQSVSMTWYTVVSRWIEHSLLRGVDLMASDDRSFLFIITSSLAVHYLAMYAMQYSVRGSFALLRRTLSRVRRAGGNRRDQRRAQRNAEKRNK